MAEYDPQSLLAMPADQVEAPKPLPAGSYVFNVNSREFDKANNEKKTQLVRFDVSPIEALPDVDQEALALVTANKSLNEIHSRHELYITPDALFRVKEFAEHCGIDSDGVSIGEQIEQCPGRQFVGVVAHTISKKDGKTVYANIVSTAAVPT